MKHTKTSGEKILHVLSAILAVAGWLSTATVLATQAQAADKVRAVNIGGYLSVAQSQAPASFNVGFSFYTAAWPLAEKYPGHRFQSGLYGTWMHPQHDGPAPANLHSDIEGDLGWWTDTRFPTETPKFIMGGVGPNFSAIANGPAHGSLTAPGSCATSSFGLADDRQPQYPARVAPHPNARRCYP